MVIPGVIAVGTVGVWRLLCSDFTTAQQETLVKRRTVHGTFNQKKKTLFSQKYIYSTNLHWVYLIYPAYLTCRQDLVLEHNDRL